MDAPLEMANRPNETWLGISYQDMSERGSRLPGVRLIVARCEVTYSGRLSAVLPEAVRLLILKGDGSVLVHDDAGGYKPLNWMTAPTFIADEGDRLVVTSRRARTPSRSACYRC